MTTGWDAMKLASMSASHGNLAAQFPLAICPSPLLRMGQLRLSASVEVEHA